MLNFFYLHFQTPQPSDRISALSDDCEKIEQIFESSYQIVFDGSPSDFRFLVKEIFNDQIYYLSIQKKGIHHAYLGD